MNAGINDNFIGAVLEFNAEPQSCDKKENIFSAMFSGKVHHEKSCYSNKTKSTRKNKTKLPVYIDFTFVLNIFVIRILVMLFSNAAVHSILQMMLVS